MSTDPNSSPIIAYLATLSGQQQQQAQALYDLIKPLLPEATEKISYQMPTFWQRHNLVHFAAFKTHLGFYPTPEAIDAFSAETAPYRTSKGTMQFAYDQPLPAELISKLVLFQLDRLG
ncbi:MULTISPECIES: iron chaperone [Lapidilactobacillus]|uniref:Iron chaperone n=1 Tax=Lapidilactobacillus achengensis TaxID=2486000 RepID=A0ABW1ULZ4_9LACO|nr:MULTISPECIES: DUF1801 domain-containing protein [Lapidilactobacillus]